MYYLYELRNTANELVYIGQSQNPKWRLYDQTKRDPRKSPSAGKFFGQDLHCVIAGQFATRTQSRKAETEHKIRNGHVPTELVASIKGAERMNAMRDNCPYCSKDNLTPGGMHNHIKAGHPNHYASYKNRKGVLH